MSWYRDVYLKSEDWKNLRASVLASEVFDHRCFVCRRRKKLDVHHVRYNNLWDVSTADLIPLCRLCHSRVHNFIEYMGRKVRISEIIKAFDLSEFHTVQMIVWRILAITYPEHREKSLAGVYRKYPCFKNFIDKCLGQP